MLEPIYIDAIWLSLAFLSGIIAKKVNFPPLIGFLLTGIVLNASGLTDGQISEVLHTLSDLGVMLLLFTIGLKINIKYLIKKEIWATASIHMIISVLALGSFVFILSYSGLQLFSNLSVKASMIIGFALSFSSTVFVIKILEERGELNSFHGKISIGILVIQDIFAVIFLTISTSQLPSLWVLTIPIYLYLIRFVLYRLLNLVGHGELLTVFGFFATFITGALSFELVGLKPDLGALIIGMLLVGHNKSKELFERMMSYKDFFLIAFFINIGLSGIPSLSVIFTALILLIFVIFKGGLFLLIFSRYKIRARTAFLSSISLTNFSEFGLITGFVGVQLGLIGEEWLLIIAVLMSFSFLASSPLNNYAHNIFNKLKPRLIRLNKGKMCVDEEPVSLGNANYLIIGMGHIGLSAYNYIASEHNDKVLGIDYDHERIEKLQLQKINALWGDSTDSIFWENVDLSQIKMILFTMNDHVSNINSIKESIKIKNRNHQIGAICHFNDERLDFEALKVDYIFDYKEHLGSDFAHGFIEDSITLTKLK